MEKIFNVTFHYSGSTYCSNVAIAACEADVKAHYSKYDEVIISEGSENDLKDAEKRNKPVIRCEAAPAPVETAAPAENDIEAAIYSLIENMSDSDIVALWNDYCDAANYPDDRIYNMYDFNDIFSGTEPEEIARRVYFGNDENREGSSFNPNRDYFYFNGYGNPVSIDYIYNGYSKEFYGPVDIDSIVSYILENENSLFNDDIAELLETA